MVLQDQEVDRSGKSSEKISNRQYGSSSRTPGAVAVQGGGGGGSSTSSNMKTRKQRGIDSDDTEKPEKDPTMMKMMTTKTTTTTKQPRGKTLGGEDFESTDAPKQNHRAIRQAVHRCEQDDGDSVSCDEDDDSTDRPGIHNMPGRGDGRARQQQQQNGGPEGLPDGAGTNSEYITAHLVEEGAVDPEERDQIIRKAKEELIHDAAKAEIAEPVDNRKWFACACIATLVIIAVVVASVVATRPDPAPVINNSFCDQSKPIKVGGSVTGSTTGSTTVDAETCAFENFNNMTKGRWYTFAGNGSPVTASTCLNTNFDTRISVFAGGSCSQNELQCIDGNEDNPSSCCAPGIVDCEERSAITWSTQNGLQYYVYVHGANPDEMGEFELSLSEAEISSESGNTVCERAVRAAVDTVVSGSNEGASVPDMASCDAVPSNGPGVWYVIEGTGSSLVASTCDSSGTLEDTQISIYTGVCNNLECVKSNDNACGTKSEVSWPTVQGKSYYIYVHSKPGTGRGSFDLRIDALAESDIDAQCFDETVALVEDGIRDEIFDLSQSLAGRINPSTACRQALSDYICVFDLLDGAETDVDQQCRSRGGRYLIKEFSFDCGDIILEFKNFPDCVSFLCRDEWLNDTMINGVDAVIQIFETTFGEKCVLIEQDFWDA